MNILEFLKWLFIDYTGGWLIVLLVSSLGLVFILLYKKVIKFIDIIVFILLFMWLISIIELI